MSKQADSIQIFFIGGQGKSGTTWLELLLDAHPEVSCRGEAHFGDVLMPLLDRAFQEYRNFLQSNNAHFPELSGYPADDASGVRNAAQAWIATCLHAQTNNKDNKTLKAIGERTPANIERMHELAELLPDCRIIHAIRDPRDVVVSLWFHGQRTNPDGFTKQYGSLNGLAEQLAPMWVAAIESARASSKTMADRYKEVRYEDMHNTPEITLAGLFEFLGASQNKKIIKNCIEAASFSKVSGRSSGDEDQGSHFRKGIVGDWRNHLDDAAQTIFQKHAGELLKELGYC